MTLTILNRLTSRMSLIMMAVALLSTPLLTGCGVKPNNVAPPPGAQDSGFPQTYPKPDAE